MSDRADLQGTHPPHSISQGTMQELITRAAARGIRITRKGYKLDGIFYRVEDWRPVLAQLDGYSPQVNQVAAWLRSTR